MSAGPFAGLPIEIEAVLSSQQKGTMYLFSIKQGDNELRQSSRLKVGSRNGRMTGCACLSQQGSRMDVPFEACMDMVENGYFDDTKPDPMPSAVGGLDALRAAGTPTAAQAQAKPAEVNKPSKSLFITQEGVKPADAW